MSKTCLQRVGRDVRTRVHLDDEGAVQVRVPVVNSGGDMAEAELLYSDVVRNSLGGLIAS